MKNKVIMGHISATLVFFSLLPFVKSSPLNSDVQPHFIIGILTVLLLAALDSRLLVSKQSLLVASLYSITCLLLGGGVYDVLSVVFLIITFSFFRSNIVIYTRNIYNAVSLSVLVYFVFSIIEIAGSHAIIDLIVSNSRNTDSRGLSSLASEPSFFGLVSLAQIVLLEKLHCEKYRYFQMIALLNLALSQSLTVIAPTLLILSIYVVLNKRSLILPIVAIIGSLAYFLHVGSESRAYGLVYTFFNDPYEILSDTSGANRLARSFGPIYISFLNGFFPFGFDNVSSHLAGVGYSLFGLDAATDVERLSNIATFMVFGFGFLAFPLLGFYIYLLWRNRVPVYYLFTIVYFFIVNISIFAPFVVLVISAPLWSNNNVTGCNDTKLRKL